MHVRFGSTTSKQGLRTTVRASDYTADELRTLAADAGVDASGNKEEIAARLSARTNFETLPDSRVTYVSVPEGVSLAEAFVTLTAANGVIANHADDVDWVETDSPGLTALLCEHYGCADGAPDDLEDTHHTVSGPPGVGPVEEDSE